MQKLLDTIKNLGNIWDGIKNSIFTSKAIKEMAEERKEICMKCPNLDHTGRTCYVPGTAPCCSLCGCKMKWKWYAPGEYCDSHLWEARKDLMK